MEHIGAGVVTVIVGAFGLAMLAVVLSNRAQTPQVLQAGGSALSAIIGAAVSPVAGGSNFGMSSFGTGISSPGSLMSSTPTL